MIPILYESTEKNFISNGLGRLRDCLRCEVTEERNGIYELEIDYPVNGHNIGQITLGRIVAVEHDETGDVQPFDIYSYSKPINGVITFRGRHISYRLNEMTVSGTGINSLSAAFTAFAGSSPACPFTFTTDKTGSNYIAAFDGTPRTIRQILGGVEGSILDSYGVEYVWDKFTVRLMTARGSRKDYSIRYGENLIDFKEDMDYSGTYSACIPYWVQDSTIIKGSMVTSGYPGMGGRTVCAPLDLTDKFDTQPTAAQLQTAAASYMASNTPYNPVQNITINFVKVDDSVTDRIISELNQFGLCDSVRVILPKYGLNAWYKIVKVVWDVLLERYIEMELGNLSTTLSEALGL